MGRISFSQINSIPDLLDQTAFLFDLGNVPLGGSTQHLAIKCLNVPIPGMGQEGMTAPLHGFQVGFSGRRTNPGTFSPTFYEDSKMQTLRTLQAWLEYTRGSESGNSGGYKRQYSVDANLIVYDTTGKAIAAHVIEMCRIQDIPDVQFDGSSSAPIQVAPTFAYDRVDWNNGRML